MLLILRVFSLLIQNDIKVLFQRFLKIIIIKKLYKIKRLKKK